ncbi:MAG: hypothetical protein Q9227_007971 [Pyrenula ochraceoflavens]
MAKLFWRRQWDRWELNERLLLDMARNALPPTAALIVTQSSSIGRGFDIVGYLPVIATILQQPALPRVVFLKQMLFTCLLNCLVLCTNLLAAYSATQARLHTTPPGGNLSAYNSSAAAVSGIWLFFTVWAIQTLRVYRPQFTVSCIVCTIFGEVGIGVGSQLGTMASHIKFNTQLTEMFFLAHGFSFADIKKYLAAAKEVLSAEAAYVAGLESSPLLATDSQATDGENDGSNVKKRFPMTITRHENTEYRNLAAAVSRLSELHNKLRADIALAKQEVGYSNVTGDDLEELFQCFRRLILTLRGTTVLMSIFRRICETRGWGIFDDSPFVPTIDKESDVKENTEERQEWKSIFGDFKQSVNDMSQMMQDGLQHVSVALGLEEPSKLELLLRCEMAKSISRNSKADVEAKGEKLPGMAGFTASLESQIAAFHARRGSNLTKWLQRKGTNHAKTIETDHRSSPPPLFGQQESDDGDKEQYFVILYMQHFNHTLSDAVLDLAKFADKVSTRKRQLILPSSRRLKKLAWSFFKEHDKPEDLSHHPTDDSNINHPPEKDIHTVKQNPRHEQQQGKRSILYRVINSFSNIIGGEQSFFGFRAACAVLSIVIVGLLAETQQWFFNQRGLLAVVFVPFTMAPNAGETWALFLFRVIGTAIAVAVSILNWYIVNGHAAGVIVFFFVFVVFEEYFNLKYPQYGGVWRGSLITRAIIIGYVLQTQFLHVPQPPATKNTAYPVYLIGPYRYACAVVGMFSAFVWTIFPRVNSARSLLRHKLGKSLFLLTLYYNCMNSTVNLWVNDKLGDPQDKRSPGRQLEKLRHKIFSQETALLTAIKTHARFSRFEPSMGKAFPAELYAKVIDEIDLIVSLMNLVVHAATTSPSASPAHQSLSEGAHGTKWSDHIAKSTSLNTSNLATTITTLLSLLSACITDKRPLPPGLVLPHSSSFLTTKHVGASNSEEVMNLRNANEPGYSVFAVIEIGQTLITESLGRVLGHVEGLVGVIDFGIEDGKRSRKEKSGKMN